MWSISLTEQPEPRADFICANDAAPCNTTQAIPSQAFITLEVLLLLPQTTITDVLCKVLVRPENLASDVLARPDASITWWAGACTKMHLHKKSFSSDCNLIPPYNLKSSFFCEDASSKKIPLSDCNPILLATWWAYTCEKILIKLQFTSIFSTVFVVVFLLWHAEKLAHIQTFGCAKKIANIRHLKPCL